MAWIEPSLLLILIRTQVAVRYSMDRETILMEYFADMYQESE
jgi:hypothetical protein